ncbi:hypothetical protein Acr_17g0007550 [Actinidia rufa]|uniref:Uncharacterized protein n=1 Tax=Actinidia rufa TaxID=165716 RepID=A0A7J0G328_9ERIC|nr:hypothetical protein Acr_17g0007550 [Actinidia rufa]
MHLRNRLLPRLSTSSLLDNRVHPMANTSQAPDLVGLHREIHGMTEQMRVMNENNARLDLAAANSPPPAAPLIPDIDKTPQAEGEETRRERSPRRSDLTRRRNMSTSQKIRDLDARLYAINMGIGAPVTVDALIRHTKLPFTERVLRARVSSRFKLPTARDLRGKNGSYGSSGFIQEPDVTPELFKQGDVQGFFYHFEGVGEIMPGPLFDSLSKNVPETLSVLQSKADKYISKEELAEAKCRQRGKDDHKRKELDTSLSKKKHARSTHGWAGEEIYSLSSPVVDAHPSITFNNDDLRGLHLPHDDALVVSAVIANFNVQRVLVDNGSSVDILFVSAFDKMRIGLDKLHPFHIPLVRLGGNMTHPLGWIKLPVTLVTEPHQITVWQDFIVVDYPSPYNAILGRPTLGGTRAITSTYHLKIKFPISTGVGEVRGDQKVAKQCFISAMKTETSAPGAQWQLQIMDDEIDVLRDEVE